MCDTNKRILKESMNTVLAIFQYRVLQRVGYLSGCDEQKIYFDKFMRKGRDGTALNEGTFYFEKQRNMFGLVLPT